MKLTKPILAATVAVFMLGGCYNQPGLVQDSSYDRTKTGAATGALAGAVIGYNTKGHNNSSITNSCNSTANNNTNGT